MRFLYDGTEYALSPHTLILVVPGVLHGIRVLSEKTYERYTFHFTSRIFAGEREGLLLRLLPTLDSVRKRNSFIPFFLEGCDRFPVLKKLNAILSLPDLDIGPENEQILASSLMESLLIHLYLIHAKDASLAAPRPAEKDPPELAEIAGSILSQTGKRVNRCRLTAALIRALSALPQTDWLDEYRAACVNLGQPVRLLAPGREPREGVAVDLGSQAELLVRFSDGTVEAVNAGEVTLRPAASTT